MKPLISFLKMQIRGGRTDKFEIICIFAHINCVI